MNKKCTHTHIRTKSVWKRPVVCSGEDNDFSVSNLSLQKDCSRLIGEIQSKMDARYTERARLMRNAACITLHGAASVFKRRRTSEFETCIENVVDENGPIRFGRRAFYPFEASVRRAAYTTYDTYTVESKNVYG